MPQLKLERKMRLTLFLTLILITGSVSKLQDLVAIKRVLMSIFSNYKQEMYELREIVESSNKHIKRVEESLSSRLTILENEFNNVENLDVMKMTRGANKGQEGASEQLQKLEQLAKIYGEIFKTRLKTIFSAAAFSVVALFHSTFFWCTLVPQHFNFECLVFQYIEHWGRTGDVLGTLWGRIGDTLGTRLGRFGDSLGTL